MTLLTPVRRVIAGNRRQQEGSPGTAQTLAGDYLSFFSAGSGPEGLVKAIEFIQDNFRGPLTVSLVARQAGLSARTLSRRFQRETGRGPGRAIVEIRMMKAAQLLRETSKPIKEIAATVGVPSLGSFGRMFAQVYGVSPAKYRLSASRAGGHSG